MSIKVYTTIPAPFRMGGRLTEYIYTVVAEYERVSIGEGYFGILFQNDHTQYWHMALEDCGALIGTNKSRAKLIKTVKEDVSSGDAKTMTSQIKQGKIDMASATFLGRESWFSKFRKNSK